jgi:hypothetical protein
MTQIGYEIHFHTVPFRTGGDIFSRAVVMEPAVKIALAGTISLISSNL